MMYSKTSTIENQDLEIFVFENSTEKSEICESIVSSPLLNRISLSDFCKNLFQTYSTPFYLISTPKRMKTSKSE